jgi:hypothetical protein
MGRCFQLFALRSFTYDWRCSRELPDSAEIIFGILDDSGLGGLFPSFRASFVAGSFFSVRKSDFYLAGFQIAHFGASDEFRTVQSEPFPTLLAVSLLCKT